ncbi:diphthamide synthesis protein [Candidatus Pacearchaeota archaeon]|nr:diphthamide synthesis protein [Candidatus Pacearchaeota archaeon]
MKVLFIEARKQAEFNRKDLEDIAEHLPKKIGLLASVQYIHLLQYVKKELEKRNKIVYLEKGKSKYEGQILGCDVSPALKSRKAEALLLIGSGKFHALQVALKTKKPVFIWQPSAKLSKITQEDIKNFEVKRKTALIKFLHANEIGILISTKQGQFNLQGALQIRKKIKNKKAFLFLFDTLNLAEFENFSCQSYINTACPNLILDDTRIINSDELIY